MGNYISSKTRITWYHGVQFQVQFYFPSTCFHLAKVTQHNVSFHYILKPCMALPTDKEGVCHFMGFVTYMSKFIPNLSEEGTPLLKSNVKFSWQPAQKKTFDRLKCFVMQASGLGAMLLKDNRPVTFISRSLIDAATRYAQIEREMLSIVHACTKFNPYIFGKQNSQATSGDVEKANEFNLFYNRFNTASPVPSPTASAAASPAESPPQPDTAAATPSTLGSSLLSFTVEVRAELNRLRPG
uniref:Reverse transcriptase RNase H-like domain-containing protein n=1 Tax=Seriola lalandi dorsalis TaxID=1841481 RepID=A0A3B4YP43_SERLL